MGMATILYYLAGLILVYVVGMFLVIPLKLLIRLLMNGIIGGALLFLFNIIGGFFALSLPITPINAIVVGVFGIPGLIVLLLLKFII